VLTLASSWIEAGISTRLSLECTLLICHSLYLQYLNLYLFNGGVNCPLIGKSHFNTCELWIAFTALWKALYMKHSTFWVIKPSSPMKVNWDFGGTCHLHLLGRRISQAKNQHEEGRKLILRPWRWRHVPPSKKPVLSKYQSYSSALQMEATCSSEMSVEFQRTTRRYIP
jgi:hypothetical protein